MRKVLTLIFILAISVMTSGQAAVSYESITVSNVAIGISAATLTIVTADGFCSGRVEGADIRVRSDGTNPTAAEGILILENEIVTVKMLSNLVDFRAIRDAGVDATLKIQCYQ